MVKSCTFLCAKSVETLFIYFSNSTIDVYYEPVNWYMFSLSYAERKDRVILSMGR